MGIYVKQKKERLGAAGESKARNPKSKIGRGGHEIRDDDQNPQALVTQNRGCTDLPRSLGTRLKMLAGAHDTARESFAD